MTRWLNELLLLPLLALVALFCRRSERQWDVGFGPLPLISYPYHKKAVEQAGYTALTFVDHVYFITDEFDERIDRWKWNRVRYGWPWLKPLYVFAWAVRNFRCLAFHFDGGPLGPDTKLLWRFEPWLLKLARVKTIVLAYGGDVQDMTRSPNLLFKHAMAVDYPGQAARRRQVAAMIDLWTQGGDFVVSGCEWVDYMYHWDKLMMSHISIDLDRFEGSAAHPPVERFTAERPLRLVHAPNHRTIKGTQHFIDAVDVLKRDGYAVELTLIERRPNEEVKRLIREADVVLDQLVIGWYAMFAMEALAYRRPVICNLRPDLVQLYRDAGVLPRDEEIPILHATPATVEGVLRGILDDPSRLPALAERSREYVERHHSTKAVSAMFGEALGKLL